MTNLAPSGSPEGLGPGETGDGAGSGAPGSLLTVPAPAYLPETNISPLRVEFASDVHDRADVAGRAERHVSAGAVSLPQSLKQALARHTPASGSSSPPSSLLSTHPLPTLVSLTLHGTHCPPTILELSGRVGNQLDGCVANASFRNGAHLPLCLTERQRRHRAPCGLRRLACMYSMAMSTNLRAWWSP